MTVKSLSNDRSSDLLINRCACIIFTVISNTKFQHIFEIMKEKKNERKKQLKSGHLKRNEIFIWFDIVHFNWRLMRNNRIKRTEWCKTKWNGSQQRPWWRWRRFFACKIHTRSLMAILKSFFPSSAVRHEWPFDSVDSGAVECVDKFISERKC